MGQIEEDVLSALNELPGKVYQQALKEIIQNNFDVPLEKCSIVIDAASAKGDNYVGVVYRAKIKDPKRKELNVIVKLPPPSLAFREQFFSGMCFLRESEFYETIFPMFKHFQEEKGIDVDKDGFYQVPLCYKSLTENLTEGLFLEDLKVSGFDMFDRFKDVTAEHVYRVMESLGKFHALSLAIKDQKPELIAPFTKMRDYFLRDDDAFRKRMNAWIGSLKKQTIDSLNESSNEDLKQKVRDVLKENFIDMITPSVDGNSAEPQSVICHGDCWNNNIMYRYENGIPVEVRLLDWQIMRYASPVCDLLYYIFACTTKALRAKHYKDFLDVYHNSLSGFLTRLGSNPSKLFPRETVDEHMRRSGKFGLGMAILVLPIFTSKPEDSLDMNLLAEKFEEASITGESIDGDESLGYSGPQANDAFNERMRGVLEDMYELNYF